MGRHPAPEHTTRVASPGALRPDTSPCRSGDAGKHCAEDVSFPCQQCAEKALKAHLLDPSTFLGHITHRDIAHDLLKRASTVPNRR